MKNLKYILANLNQWLDKEDNDYKHRSAIYDGIIMQYLTYMLHVYHNIGGIYLHEKLVGDKVEALESEPKEKQKEAMSYFLEQLETLDWLDNSDVLDKLPIGETVKGILHPEGKEDKQETKNEEPKKDEKKK